MEKLKLEDIYSLINYLKLEDELEYKLKKYDITIRYETSYSGNIELTIFIGHINDAEYFEFEIQNIEHVKNQPPNIENEKHFKRLTTHLNKRKLDLKSIFEKIKIEKKKTSKSIPRYVHDCKKCIFIGINGIYDVYLHVYPKNELKTLSLIYRYSDEGQDYDSLPLGHIYQEELQEVLEKFISRYNQKDKEKN